jgi:molybdate transport system substrate-binding protein
MTTPLKVISSMATRKLLTEAASEFAKARGQGVEVESVGGVDAAKRVQAGELFDVVILASNVIDQLIGERHVLAGRADIVRSGVAVMVPSGAARPDISTEAGLRAAVSQARSIGYSTGPSGNHLMGLFERWGIAEAVKPRVVQAKPGNPVAALVARGDVALGFQQLSEVMGVDGVEIVGPLPEGVQTITVFAGGVAAVSGQPEAARAWLEFLCSPALEATKRRNGMEPA